MKVDMSPEAVTNRMIALDALWELAVALKSSKVEEHAAERADHSPTNQTSQNEKT